MQRHAGPLAVDDKLLKVLALLHRRTKGFAPNSLELRSVQHLEQQLGDRVHDDVLAYLAATGRDPVQVLTLTEDAQEQGLPRHLIAFSREKTSAVYFCVDVRDAEVSPIPVRGWDAYQGERKVWPGMATFVCWLHGLDVKAGDEEDELPVPRIVDSPDTTELRRVHHGRFGIGTVVQVIAAPTPKLVIDFGPKVGHKTILCTFVTDVDEDTVDDGPEGGSAGEGGKKKRGRPRKSKAAA